jgi:hypothetical protein
MSQLAVPSLQVKQAALHGLPLPTHLPPLHRSVSVQYVPSSQKEPSATGCDSHCPFAGLHATTWHTAAAASVHDTALAVSRTQFPPVQASRPRQRFWFCASQSSSIRQAGSGLVAPPRPAFSAVPAPATSAPPIADEPPSGALPPATAPPPPTSEPPPPLEMSPETPASPEPHANSKSEAATICQIRITILVSFAGDVARGEARGARRVSAARNLWLRWCMSSPNPYSGRSGWQPRLVDQRHLP